MCLLVKFSLDFLLLTVNSDQRHGHNQLQSSDNHQHSSVDEQHRRNHGPSFTKRIQPNDAVRDVISDAVYRLSAAELSLVLAQSAAALALGTGG